MKKTAAILLLCVHLFNAGGYMLLYQYLIQRSEAFSEKQISKGLYNVHDLVDVKIPVHMQYVQDWPDYEQISGQVQVKGNRYNYVKLRVTHDTIFIKCIPNYVTTTLIKSNIIYAKQVSDVPVNKKGNTNLIKTFNFYTCFQLMSAYHAEQTPIVMLKATNPYLDNALAEGFRNVLHQPPQFSFLYTLPAANC